MNVVSERDVDVEKIAIVGEFTTAGGPMFDDYFLVLVQHSGEVVEIPFDAPQVDAILDKLKTKFGIDAGGALANRTDFVSHITYPPLLEGHPIFVFHEVRQSLWTKIRGFGVGEVAKELTPEVQAHLRSGRN